MTTSETINNELAIFNKAVQNKRNISKADILRLLDTFRKICGVDVVYILEVVPSNDAFTFTHVSAAMDDMDLTGFNIHFTEKEFSISKEFFDSDNLCDAPEIAHKERGIKALLQYGCFHGNNLDGCIGMLDFHNERKWTKSERSAILKLGRTLHYIIVDSRQTKLLEEREQQLIRERQQARVLHSMAAIYLTVHLIDLKENTGFEFASFNFADSFIRQSSKASEQMKLALINNAYPEFHKELIEFSNFKTLEKRMLGKKSISIDFCGIHFGWVKAQYIVSDTDEKGRITKVVFTTQVIDEEKRKEQNLIRISNTDELTQVNNRRAYDFAIKEYESSPLSQDFVMVAFDVNSLKRTNDEAGHAAGDELLQGVAQCICETYGTIGKVFRTGGDEFCCIMNAQEEKLKEISMLFEQKQKKWKGKLNKKLSASVGIARACQNKGKTVHELERIADQMMYENKKEYYQKSGNERRK